MGWSRNRSRIASNFWRKISGTPGRMYTFRIRTVGNRTVSPPTSSAPSGIAAILRCESFSRSRKCRSRMPTSSGWRTSLTSIARATPSMVTSSWVGPTPPDVNTTSWSRLNAATSRAITSISSGMTAMRRTSTPSARSSRHRYAALASAILPERISLPTRMIPAVFGMAPGDSTMLEYGRPREGDAMIQLSGKALGHEAVFFNVNAADPDKRAEVVSQMERVLEERGEVGTVRVLLHSLAFGTLKLYVADPMKEVVTPAQMDMTLDVMAHSLVYWVQEVVGRGLMTRGGRIYAMTSSGGSRVLPFYGPVSAAKAALESHVRQLAAELAPQGITANAVRAGVTDTPALQKIPRHEAIIAEARRRNPSGRMTTTEDVARAIVVLAHPDTYWITGNVIGVDGGEDIVG